MMKKKILSLLLVTMSICSLPAYASTSNNTDKNEESYVSEESIEEGQVNVDSWDYIIYDSEGTIQSEGIFSPNVDNKIMPKIDLVDDDITLKNGQSVMLTPKGSYRGLYASKGTDMTIIYKLDRAAKINVIISPYSDHVGRYNKTLSSKTYQDIYVTPSSDYYYALITNYSSDNITLKDFYMIF